MLITGPSGSGKSTLLRALAGVLGTTESGELSGLVLVDGDATAGHPAGIDEAAAASSVSVGLLLQDPVDALVAETVGRDTAFGLENLGVDRARMGARIAQTLDAVSFPYGTNHSSSQLSGGEAQRLALAGVLVMGPRLVLLDEPTSMLDPASAAAVREAVWATAAASGATLIVVEHQLAEWLPRITRLVVLGEGGEIVADGEASVTLVARRDALARAGVWVPGSAPPVPQQVSAALCRHGPVQQAKRANQFGDPVVSARKVGVTLQRATSFGQRGTTRGAAVPILADVSADIVAGEITAIVGPSGAGKSTFTALLAGLSNPSSGVVVWVGGGVEGPAERRPAGKRPAGTGTAGTGTAEQHPGRWSSRRLAERVGWVPQNAELAIVARTVRDDVLNTSVLLGHDIREAEHRVDALLDVLGLTELAAEDPHHLSGGELRRVALAGAVAHGPALLVLDEPTVGLDRHTWSAVAGVVVAAREAGVAVVVATHDPLLVQLADRVVRLESGRVVGRMSRFGPTPTETFPTEMSPTETTPTETTPTETTPTETSPTETSPTETSPTETFPTGTFPTGTFPTEKSPTEKSPTGTTRGPGTRAERAGFSFGFARRCGPLSLLAGGLLLLLGSLFITSIGQAIVGVIVLLAVAPLVLDLRSIRLRRLAPGLLAAASVAFSTWLLSPDQSLLAGVTAGLRIAFFVLPGVLLAGYIEPSSLGDHLGQLLHLPARPVIAATAALQQFSTLTEQWQQLQRVRRVRGLSAGRSPLSRASQFGSLTFALLVQSVRKAGRMAVAMDARGFSRLETPTLETSSHARTWAEPAYWTRGDTVLLVVVGFVASVPAVYGSVHGSVLGSVF
ncbi:hypothetical protein GCM10009563_17790 [Subtercola frigoramans]